MLTFNFGALLFPLVFEEFLRGFREAADCQFLVLPAKGSESLYNGF